MTTPATAGKPPIRTARKLLNENYGPNLMKASILSFLSSISKGLFLRKGLRVLMYHNITTSEKPGRLNVTPNQFAQHLLYLQANGYKNVSLSELLHPDYKGGDKTYLLTFDDGYKNNLYDMYPILKKFNAKCCIFLVPSFISDRVAGSDYMNADELKRFDPEIVEFALHGYDHTSYADLSYEKIITDIRKSKQFFENVGLHILPAFAYPYGAYPKKNKNQREKMLSALRNENIAMAFRIGNRINPLPFSNRLLIERVDIRGDYSLRTFARKIRAGKLLFF